MAQLAAGSLIYNRFEIEGLAGSGGMGAVYRARDRYTGDQVALKLLHAEGSETRDADRFAREAQLLSELRHPAIVSYVAHGQAPDGQRFLAMEWLEGEDMAQRLSRGALSLPDCVLLLDRVAEALDIAHQRGVVHRDIKPSNLFLQGGEIGRVKVLDFGIARRLSSSQGMTSTGMVIGTPEYMAPEQARGVRQLTPAVDIFSLGCVLYQCLTGKPPFGADHVAAVLVRILLEDPPPLEERRPGVPESVHELLRQMLHKDPAQRLPNGGVLREMVRRLGDLPEIAQAPTTQVPSARQSAFAESEQDLYSVVLAMPSQEVSPVDRTVESSEERSKEHAKQGLLDALAALGVAAEFIASGALVVTVPAMGSATDRATRAARAALLTKERWPEASVSIATGRGAIQGRVAVGEVIERAARALRPGTATAFGTPTPGVLADPLTAELLGGRFLQTPRPDGTLLLLEERNVDASRPLLGKPTPCVGREAELSMLEAQLCSCLDEQEARVTLVTALPGTGKSRLRHEFLRRVAQRSEPVNVILGRGDLMTACAPYGVLGQALRSYCGLQSGSSPDVQRAQFTAHIGRYLPEPSRLRVTCLLGELCGLSFPDDAEGQLAAVHRDPRLLHEQIRRSFVEWLAAECEHGGVLVVIDDLQWGDSLSVGLLDVALHELRAASLCVLALARPEVHEAFPRLWTGHKVQEISLKGLSRKACERLVQQILGKQVPADAIARIVEQSSGNALFLEELIRAAGEGAKDGQPDTVVAMLQARISRFEAGPRRAVRAASVFGQTFWRGGVAELLGLPDKDPQLDAWLSTLVDAEVIEPRADSRLPEEKEYGFRHALVREAAYSLLTDSDLLTGHLLAARYLDRLQLPEPMVLAEHYRRGGELAEAVPLYLRAAEVASRKLALPEERGLYLQVSALLDALPGTPERSRLKVDILLKQILNGIQTEPTPKTFSLLAEARSLMASLGAAEQGEEPGDQRRNCWINLLTGRAYFYQGQPREAMVHYQRLLPVAEALGDKELLALPLSFIGSAYLTQGDARKGLALLSRAANLAEQFDNQYDRLRVPGTYGMALMMCGRYRETTTLFEQLRARAVDSKQPAALSLTHTFHAITFLFCSDYQRLLESAQRALEYAQKSGDRVYVFASLSLIGYAQSNLGKHEEALSYRAQARQLEQELGGRIILADWLTAADIGIALRAGELKQAIGLAEQIVPTFQKEDRLLALAWAKQGWGLALGRRDPNAHPEADGLLSAALQLLESVDQVLASARLRLEWAQLCRRRGSIEQGEALRAQGVAQFEAAGCAHVIAGIEHSCELGWPS